MNKHLITKEGEQALREELDKLKSKEWPRINKAKTEVKDLTDLEEKTEYCVEKELQRFCEKRINEIERKLANTQVIDANRMKGSGKVVFGTKVRLLNLDNDEEMTVKIVGEDEVDLNQGKVSFKSPIASGLIQKSVGDIVDIETPKGKVEYEILELE